MARWCKAHTHTPVTRREQLVESSRYDLRTDIVSYAITPLRNRLNRLI